MSFTISRKTSATSKVEWIIPDLIVRNDVNLIDGRKSCGKSSAVAKILGDWHNQLGLPKWQQLRNILWLSSEENFDSIIKPRLMQYGISEDQITTIDYKNGNSSKPEFPRDREAMYRFMNDNSINALVIDPFSEVKPVEWSINDGDQMRSYMTSFVSLCFGLECTAFALRHMRKSSGSFSGDDGIGSVQIKASIRHPLRIDVTEEKIKRRFLTVEESNIAKASMPMQFGFTDTDNSFGKIEWMGHKDISIDELKKLAESKVKRSKLEDGKVLLTQALHDGDKAANELIEEAKENGIGDRTLDDAKADLQVSSHRIVPMQGKAYFVWRLPEALRSKDYVIIKGKDMPQLTITDLTEYAEQPIKTLADYPPPFQYEGPTEAEIQASYDEVGKEIADEITAIEEGKTRKPSTKKPSTKKPSTRKPSTRKPSTKNKQASA